MPEFSITVQTVRVGTHSLHVIAADVESARAQVEAECESGACHCPPDWCTDDVTSSLVGVRRLSAQAPRDS